MDPHYFERLGKSAGDPPGTTMREGGAGEEEREDEGEGSGLEFGVGGGMEEQKVSHINQAPKTLSPFALSAIRAAGEHTVSCTSCF